MPGPISPSAAAKAKVSSIPDFVFEAFNELIVENLSNGEAKVTQREVVYRIRNKMPSGADLDTRWLDVESSYRKAGWKVTYDKPGCEELYEAYFVFEKK